MKNFLQSLFILLCIAGSAMAQDRTVTGTVTGKDDGLPLPGVSVVVKGTKNGTQTGANGKYSLIVPSGPASLEFSYLGYTPQIVTLTSSNVINVSLAPDNKTLSEVVVTAMGISRESKALGYAVGKVSPGEILQKSEPDMLKTLQGKVAGVDIRTSQGTPGAATRIQIRGNSSFFGENQPLIVVDGVPYSNDQITTSNQTTGGGAYGSGISNLDPNDIASMEVFKGSAAGALYGSRASNGVLLITTKSGNAKRSNKGMEINFRTSASIENVANLPIYQNSYGAGSQGNYSASNGSWGPSFSSLSEIPTWNDYAVAYPELFGATVPYKAYPNNVKDLFRTGAVFENSLTFNGGDEKTAFSMTASQLNQDGYVDYSSYDRSNISLGGSTKLAMGLNVRGNLSYTRSTQKGGVFGENQVDGAASLFARSLFLARNWDLNLPFEDKLGNNITPLGGGQFDNPRWSAKYNTATTAEERIIANMHADMKLTDWAQIDFSLGSNVNTLNRREITEISSRAAEGLGRLTADSYRKQEIESNLFLTLKPKIGEDFSLRTIVGLNYNQRTATRVTDIGNKFIARGTYSLQNTSQQIFDTDTYERRRLMGIYADASLGYKGWAYITLTGRNDWSSTLPVSNRSYFYPGVSGSLIFTDALKLESKILDFGKIRVGYAKVGRDADPYSLLNVFEIGKNFLGQSTETIPNSANKPDLKPEFTKEFEIGTQLSFFNKLVELDFTYYNKNSNNLIAPVSTAPSSGYGQYYTNFGNINNKGQEIELTVRPLRGKEFNWEINSSFTRNRNFVTKTMEGVQRFPILNVLTTVGPYVEAGMPFGYLRGTTSARDEEGNLLINPSTGGMIENLDQGMIGDPNPKYKLGVTNTFTYKGLSLGILFDMTKGGSIYSTTISSLLGRGVTKDTEDRSDLYVIPGVYADPITLKPILDGSGNKIQNTTRLTQNDLWFSPNATLGQTFAINTATEWNTYDATVYRLREVTLAYNVPKSLFKKVPIGSLVVSLTGRNLWFVAPNVPKYTNFDPEVNSFGASSTQGIELSAAPTTRRYGFNLSVTF
jgi:TonB-linked SusC/RagA family outer membrane protein